MYCVTWGDARPKVDRIGLWYHSGHMGDDARHITSNRLTPRVTRCMFPTLQGRKRIASRSYMRRIGTLASIVLLTGCVHRLSSDMDHWVGKSADEIVSAWGAPTGTASLTNGGRVLTWEREYRTDAGLRAVCIRNVTVAPTNTIASWSASGCPAFHF